MRAGSPGVAGRGPEPFPPGLCHLLTHTCEHVFVTSQGSSATRFRRAIERRSLINAERAAREMRHVSLEQALQLVALYCEQDDPRAERAMVRWLSRLFAEKPLSFRLPPSASIS